MQVTSHKTKDQKVEAIVGVIDEELKGNVRLQIWGPKVNTKQNKWRVLVTKVEGYDSDIVGKVSKNLIQPRLEQKMEDTREKKILQADLMKANTTLSEMIREKQANSKVNVQKVEEEVKI